MSIPRTEDFHHGLLEDMAKEKGVGVLSLVVDLLEGEQTHVVY